MVLSHLHLDLGRWICKVLEPEEATPGSIFLCCRASLHLKRSMGDSEAPDIFQHQSTGYLRTRGRLCMRLHSH